MSGKSGENRVSFLLDDFEFAQLQAMAEARGTTPGSLAREPVRSWIGSPSFLSLLKRTLLWKEGKTVFDSLKGSD